MEEKLPSWAVCAKNAPTIRKNRIVRIDANQPAIAKHIKNIFSSGELDKERVYSKMEYTATDVGVSKSCFLNYERKFRSYACVNAFLCAIMEVLKHHIEFILY